MDDKDLILTENADAAEILEAIPAIAEGIAGVIQHISRHLIYVAESFKQWAANLDDEQKALLYEKILSTLHEKE